MRILFVFDKFKDALSAVEACAAGEAVVREGFPGASADAAPLTDGGEGFAEILTRSADGELRRVSVCGPRFSQVEAVYGMVNLEKVRAGVRSRCGFPDRGKLAVLEMARSSGLEQVPAGDRNPFATTTYGTGEMLAEATAQGACAILMGVGGSATHDLGLGALAALGLKAVPDRTPATAHPGAPWVPAQWDGIEALSAAEIRRLPPVAIACDVENPLLGENGAAAVFAPQKGAADGDVSRLEGAGARMARLLCGTFGVSESAMNEPGAGAAGGIAFGLGVACGARRVSGFELVSDWLGLPECLGAADVIVTGEGRFDRGSLGGKGPGRVVREAVAMDKKVAVVAGSLDLSDEETATLRNAGVRLEAVTPEGMPLEEALPRTAALLKDAVRRVLE